MPNRVRDINLVNFTGGLNLRANEFGLGEDESPEMVNVEVDPAGGMQSRKGWQKWKTDAVDIAAIGSWNPRAAYVHEMSSGLDTVLISNDGKIYWSTTGDFATLDTAAATPLTCDAGDHLADFASWGNEVYIACGPTGRAAKWGGGTYAEYITGLTLSSHWENDYTNPGATDRFMRARFIANHASRMYVAYTTEESVDQPHRVRWSHPNNPLRWAQDDYVDIKGGGGPITAIVPHGDHLLVFKQNSIWAIYGYSGNDDLQIVNVSRNAGAYSRSCVAVSEDAVYFVSWPQGVFRIDNGAITEVSMALRPALTSAKFDRTSLDKMFLGWMGQRLWWSCPYQAGALAGDAKAVFVFDPSILHDRGGVGSWTMFRSASGGGVGPFAQGGFGQGSIDLFACCRDVPSLLRLEARDAATDWLDDADVGFETRYTTRWLFDGTPELKKRWKRPTFLARPSSLDYRLNVTVFANYEEDHPKRSFGLSVDAKQGAITYDGGFMYDDDHEYSGIGNQGTEMKVASGFGSSASVQLQIDGETGKAWALDGIVAKYRPRRFR